MRILIQRIGSNEFYGAPGRWVPTAEQAFDFEATVRAINFVVENKLESVQIVLRFQGSAKNAVISMKSSPPSS